MTGEPAGCAWTTGDAVPPQLPAQDEQVGVSGACGPPMPDPASKRASVPVTPDGSAPWSSQQGAASMTSASVATPLQQVRAGPAIAAAIQSWISNANTKAIVGKRFDRTATFNDKPQASGLREVKRQRETEVPMARLQASRAATRSVRRRSSADKVVILSPCLRRVAISTVRPCRDEATGAGQRGRPSRPHCLEVINEPFKESS